MVCKRLAFVPAAADLIGEVPVQQVAERYKVTKGQVQGLQDRAGACR